jgi:hypothetical protein
METSFYYAECARRKAQKRKALQEGEVEQLKHGKTVHIGADAPPPEHRPPRPPKRTPIVQANMGTAVTAAPGPATTTVKRVVVKSRARQVATAGAPAATQASRAHPSGAASTSRRVAAAPRAAANRRAPARVRAPAIPALEATALQPVVPVLAASTPAAEPHPHAVPAAPPASGGAAGGPTVERSLLESKEMDLFRSGRLKASEEPVLVLEPDLKPALQPQPLLQLQPEPAPAPAPPKEAPACPECRHGLARVVCAGHFVDACLSCQGFWLPASVVREMASTGGWFHEAASAVATAAEALSPAKPS